MICSFLMENRRMKTIITIFCLAIFLLNSVCWGGEKSTARNSTKKATVPASVKKKKLNNNCTAAYESFKAQYFELRNYLNYGDSGEKELVYKNKKITTQVRTEKDEFGGKQLEAELYNEYKNALKKVAALYKDYVTTPATTPNQSNPLLVKFFTSISSPSFNENNDKSINIDDIKNLLDLLQEKSKENSNPLFRINDDDKYLLQELLTHVTDQYCASRDGKPYVKKFPINRMIALLNKAKITKDTEILLVEQEKVIEIAVKGQLEKLRTFINNNRNCFFRKDSNGKDHAKLEFLTNLKFEIQTCNVESFLNILNEGPTRDLETILHFVNANSRGRKPVGTNLKIEHFDNFVNNIFTGADCNVLDGILSITNLPKDSPLPMENITCKDAKNTLIDCKNAIEFKTDSGTLKQIGLKDEATEISISIKDQTKCQNIKLKNNIEKPIVEKTPPEVVCLKTEGLKKDPKDNKCIPLTKDDCVENEAFNSKSNKCEELNCNKETQIIENHACKNKPAAEVPAPQTTPECKTEEGKVLNNEKTACRNMTKEDCKEPNSVFVEETHTCRALTSDDCTVKGEIIKDNKCVPKPSNGEEACDKQNFENGVRISSKFKWDEANNKCNGPKEESSDSPQEDNTNSTFVPDTTEKPVPGRFKEITIPSRNPGMLPGDARIYPGLSF